jgi:hypothetical protein
MIYHGSNPIVRRSQGLTADDEFFCANCGAQGRLLHFDCWGIDEEGQPDRYSDYQVICTVCDADHIEFKADIFYKQIIAAEKKARQHIIDQLPAGDYKRRLVSDDWEPVQEDYWNRVKTMLSRLAAGLNDAELALFEEVAASRGWVSPSVGDAADGEELDFNIMAESEADFEEERDFDQLIATLSATLAGLSRSAVSPANSF